MKLFSIRDSKAEASLLPFSMRSRGEAIRAFGDACKRFGDELNNKEPSPLAIHPEDYFLTEVGEFDEFTGIVKGYDVPVSVCAGADFSVSVSQE